MFNDDELLLVTDHDDDIKDYESDTLDKIRNQVLNINGELSNTASDTDFIEEYIQTVFGEDTDAIDEFESHYQFEGGEMRYDVLVNGIIDILRSIVGIKLDLERETLSFKDIYDLYVTFVIDLNLTLSSVYQYETKVNNESESIESILTDDDYSFTDRFVQSAADNEPGNVTLRDIRHNVEDFVVSFDAEKFSTYVYMYIQQVM